MKNKAFVVTLALLLWLGHWAFGMPQAPSFPDIKITISKNQYTRLVESKGQKVDLKEPVLAINGKALGVEEIHSRGNNSLNFEHKSLSVDLTEPAEFQSGGRVVKLRKFDLLNLVMDKNLWHNRWAFLGMAELGIFPLYNSFCTLWINDQPQGVYLLVEKPHHYTVNSGSPFAIRRGPNNAIDDEYNDSPSREDNKKFHDMYLELYRELTKQKGEALFKHLESALVTDSYFSWLAFNYLIMNGDYADEVFFYIDPSTKKFSILPWDYDDILRPAPHEGFRARNAVEGFREKLIFSSEDALDRAIATDDYTYQQYLTSFRKLLSVLSPESITRLTEQVRSELKAVSSNPVVSKASLFLGKDPFTLENADLEINLGLDFVIKRRRALELKLN